MKDFARGDSKFSSWLGRHFADWGPPKPSRPTDRRWGLIVHVAQGSRKRIGSAGVGGGGRKRCWQCCPDTRPRQSLLGPPPQTPHTRSFRNHRSVLSQPRGAAVWKRGAHGPAVPPGATGEGPSLPFPASGGSSHPLGSGGGGGGRTSGPDGAGARDLPSTRGSRAARSGLAVLILLRPCPGTHQFSEGRRVGSPCQSGICRDTAGRGWNDPRGDRHDELMFSLI